MSEKSPNSFFYRPCLPRKRRGRCGLRRQGGFMSCAPACWSVARCVCVRRGLHSRGGALERLVARHGTCSNQARQAFLCRVSPRRGGPGINRPRRPGEKVDAAQAFALARAHVVPRGLPGEAIPFASGSAGQRPVLPCRERRSPNRSCGAVRQTQGRERRAWLSVRTCAASMLDHEKRGRIGHPPPLSS